MGWMLGAAALVSLAALGRSAYATYAVARPQPSRVRRTLRTGRGQLDLLTGREVGLLEALSTDFTEIRPGRRT